MLHQNHLIEQLTNTDSVRSFWQLATQAFSTELDSLVERVFRQPNFALKSVVDSLFEHQGPLAERSVKLKLLLGLGVISAEIYQDLTACFEQQATLAKLPSFTEPAMLRFADSLHSADLSQFHRLSQTLPKIDASHPMQHQMQQLRIEKMVRSGLILAVVEILEALQTEKTL